MLTRNVKAPLSWRPLPFARGLAAGLALLGSFWGERAIAGGREEARLLLHGVRSWGCQYQKIDAGKLAELPLDLLVIEAALPEDPSRDLPPGQVALLKTKPDGSRRLVFAYLSAGEAAEYRSYWDPRWKTQTPPWLGDPNPAWPQARAVRYWSEEWRGILFKNKDSLLDRILDAGFDGAFLDRVDAYNDWRVENPRAKADMIQLIEELAAKARKERPAFLLIGQNSEELLQMPQYRKLIDAVSKESLLYGLHGENLENTPEDVAWSLAGLNAAKADGLPVFTIEYVTAPEAILGAKQTTRRLGFTPFLATRLLDTPPIPFE